ncbi:unnamed protein product [Boreogadus saida]
MEGKLGDPLGCCLVSLVEATLKDALEGEWNKLEALAAVELVLELHPGDKMETHRNRRSARIISLHKHGDTESGGLWQPGCGYIGRLLRGTGGTLLNSKGATSRHHS